MKYVMALTDQDPPQKVPIIMPNYFIHIDMFKALEAFIQATFNCGCIPFSAGEISFYGGTVVCSGSSKTLGLESHQDDALVIKGYDYFHGMDMSDMPETIKALKI